MWRCSWPSELRVRCARGGWAVSIRVSARASRIGVDAALVEEAHRVVDIFAEGGPARKPAAFVQPDGSRLRDSRLEANDGQSFVPDVLHEMLEHEARQAA